MRFLIPLKGSIQNPTYSPDGKRFLFTRYRGGYSVGAADIYICSIMERENLVLVTDGDLQGQENCNSPGYQSTWHPSGWIVFSSDLDGQRWPCKIRADGTGFAWLLPRDTDAGVTGINPTMAPNGLDFAFERHDVEESIIVVKRFDTAAPTYLEGLTRMHRPSWSPDGKWISFESMGENGLRQVVVFELATKRLTQMTPIAGNFHSATWSPASNSLLCVGPDGLYEAGLGGRPHLLYSKAQDDRRAIAFMGSPSWCPDGTAKKRRILCEGSDRDSPDGGPGSWLEIF